MIYLDNAATTKPSAKAIEDALNFNTEKYFNPSALYKNGLDVAKEIKKAKDDLLRVIGATGYDVIFTASGSESDNTAILKCVKRGVYVTDRGEHSAVYNCFKELENQGNKVFYTDLNADGTVNVDSLIDLCKKHNPDFVSIMHINNETGGINDVNYISKIVKEINAKTIFHSDGVQAFGKIPFTISQNIDFYSVSAHKINGLKGVGALYYKKGITFSPLIFGGGQEYGRRSGTENVFGIKVFQNVANSHFNEITKNFSYVLSLKEKLVSLLDKNLFHIISSANSSPYILSISAIGLKGEVIMHALEDCGILLGNGSACSSKHPFSRVIKACGFKNDILNGVLRISFSSENTLDEIIYTAKMLSENVKKFKEIMR